MAEGLSERLTETPSQGEGVAPAASSDNYDLKSEDARKKASALLTKYLRRSRQLRQHFEREWFQYVLFYSGNQWIIWDRKRQQWRNKKGPDNLNYPVTNVFAEKIDDNVASLVKQSPTKNWRPETDDPDDIATAEIADRIDEVIEAECGRKRYMREFASWAVLCGSAFIETWYDNSEEFGTVFVQFDQCQACGATGPPSEFKPNGPAQPGQCPACAHGRHKPAFEMRGSSCDNCGFEGDAEFAFGACPQCTVNAASMAAQPPPDTAIGQEMNPLAEPGMPEPEIGVMEPLYDQSQPVGEDYPRGKVQMKIRSPFEVFVDHAQIEDMTPSGGMRWCITVDLIDAEEAREKYNIKPGKPTSDSPTQGGVSELYRESLALLSNGLGIESSGLYGAVRGAGSPSGEANTTIVETLWMLPNKDYPQGLRYVRVNGENGDSVELDPIPYHTSRGEEFIPLIHYRFKVQPGRFWGKALSVDLVPLQKQRNMTEALMVMSERRMAMPNWLIPVGLVKTPPTGEPGEIVYYKSLGDGTQSRGSIPQKLDGVEPARYFMYRLEALDQKMEQIAGSFGIAGGEPPKGVTAASAIAILVERQQHQISPQMEAWEQSLEELARQQMNIFRELAVDDRILAIGGRNSVWKTERWSAADLSGAVNVSIEPGSAMPKSNASQRASAEALVRMGAAPIEDPQVRRKILERFGETSLIENEDIDQLSAERENDKFWRLSTGKSGGDLPFFREEIDNHPVHLERHLLFAKSDDYLLLIQKSQAGDQESTAIMAAFDQHIQHHKQSIIKEMQAEQAAQSGQQAPEGQQGDWRPGPGRPDNTGAVLSRGARAQGEEGTRDVLEPSTGIQ